MFQIANHRFCNDFFRMSLIHGQNFIDETFYHGYKDTFFARLKKESTDPAEKLHTKQSKNLMKLD